MIFHVNNFLNLCNSTIVLNEALRLIFILLFDNLNLFLGHATANQSQTRKSTKLQKQRTQFNWQFSTCNVTTPATIHSMQKLILERHQKKTLNFLWRIDRLVKILQTLFAVSMISPLRLAHERDSWWRLEVQQTFVSRGIAMIEEFVKMIE